MYIVLRKKLHPEATIIVVGTTNDGDVSETELRDVVANRPWYRR
jgi:hypothetical protein